MIVPRYAEHLSHPVLERGIDDQRMSIAGQFRAASD